MSRRLAVVVYSSDNILWTRQAIDYLRTNTHDAEIVVVDNGSTPPYSEMDEGLWDPLGDRLIRYEENIGGNAIFHRWLVDGWWDEQPEFIAFLHCDLMVREPSWDTRVLAAFDADPALDLVGFVGSSQIDRAGGRGGGTVLNFRGDHYTNYGQASPAEVHGERIHGLRPAAVVDHCAMILRSHTLATLTPQEGHYAPEHFYDRLLSCEILKRGGHIAVLGIECDHFSGGIGDGMHKADELRRRWLDAEGIAYQSFDTYSAVYLESERRFFSEYRGFFPLTVDAQYQIHHP